MMVVFRYQRHQQLDQNQPQLNVHVYRNKSAMDIDLPIIYDDERYDVFYGLLNTLAQAGLKPKYKFVMYRMILTFESNEQAVAARLVMP
jgi:hypothetical protein